MGRSSFGLLAEQATATGCGFASVEIRCDGLFPHSLVEGERLRGRDLQRSEVAMKRVYEII